jgi:hypothetical protein
MIDEMVKPGPKTTIKDVQAQVDEVAKNSAIIAAKTIDAISALNEKLDSLSRAINNPVIIRSTMEPPDAVSQDLHFKADGNIERPRIMDVNSPEFKAKTEQELIDRSLVKVFVEETNRDEDMHFDSRFMISINGLSLVLEEGKEYTIPVMHLVGLYQSCRTKVGSKEYVDNADGIRKVSYPSITAQRHPVTVIECEHPKARAYLAKIKSQIQRVRAA